MWMYRRNFIDRRLEQPGQNYKKSAYFLLVPHQRVKKYFKLHLRYFLDEWLLYIHDCCNIRLIANLEK